KKKSSRKKNENSPEVTKKQPRGKKKEHLSVTTKGKSKEEKQAANEEKEEKKREKLQKKKALDERDFNVLCQLSKLNKAVVVVDEQGREILNDSGLDLADDIDVAEATTLISVQQRSGTPSHPAVGMKRPRSRPTIPTANKYPRRQPEELKEANALLTEQLTQYRMESTNTIQQSEAPRPGKVPKAIAEKYHVRVFLFIHTCVYIYESHITKAYSKQTATATARFLLSCFYNDEELIGKSLTGKNGKQCLNGDILESIPSYTRKKFDGVCNSIIRIAMRNKITCLETNAKKKRAVSSS
ncbi:unnamed protein product, partial [Pocillopora meandrina]